MREQKTQQFGCHFRNERVLEIHSTATPDGVIILVVMDISEGKLAEVSLLHAKQTAEAASLAKSTFLANMSHELRTPMNGVMGMIDMVLRRMQMPNLNGVDATKAIRADPLNRDTPILAMTANAFEEDRQTCLAAGMNDHIGKPVDPEQLFEKMLKWLERAHMTESPASEKVALKP